jgi:hypothetical protein
MTSVEILKEVQPPAQSNLTWTFRVRLNGGEPVDWRVDSFDLGIWFKDAVGRYPRNERGDSEERADILENWPRVEPRLRAEAEKEVGLGVKIGVDGMRFGAKESQEAYSIPKEDLPPLTDGQREVARKLGISEEGYARSFVAGERTSEWLLEKTARFANLLQRKVAAIRPEAKVEAVFLRTTERRFDIVLKLCGREVPLRVSEDLVDDLFESGSRQAERGLERLLQLNVGQRVQQ